MDLMQIRRGLMTQMASGKWKSVTASPSTQLTRADGVKNFLLQYIGNHKRAFAMLDYDFSESLPSTDRKFCAAVLYDGFTVSSWTRSKNGSDLQTNHSTASNNYWTSVYDMLLATTDSVTILIDMDS